MGVSLLENVTFFVCKIQLAKVTKEQCILCIVRWWIIAKNIFKTSHYILCFHGILTSHQQSHLCTYKLCYIQSGSSHE